MSLPPSANDEGQSLGDKGLQDKKDLRKKLLAVRKAIPEDLKKRYDHALCLRIKSWLEENGVKTVSTYLPIRNEPDLMELYEALSGKVQMALPYVPAKDCPLQFMAWQPGDELVEGAFHIPIPKAMRQVPMPDALIIPLWRGILRPYLGRAGQYPDRWRGIQQPENRFPSGKVRYATQRHHHRDWD